MRRRALRLAPRRQTASDETRSDHLVQSLSGLCHLVRLPVAVVDVAFAGAMVRPLGLDPRAPARLVMRWFAFGARRARSIGHGLALGAHRAD